MREDQTERKREGKDRTVLDLVRLVRDGWVALAFAVSLGLLVGVLATYLQKTEYEAQGSVVVSSAKGFLSPENADAYPALTDTARRLLKTPAVLVPTAQAYVSSAKDPRVQSQRRDEVSLAWLRDHLTAKQVSITSIIEITGTASTQANATALAQAASNSLEKVVGGAGGGPGAGGISVKEFSAGEPKGQVSPTPARNLVLGGNAGLLIGIVVALAYGASRRILRRPEEVADALGLPLVGRLRRQNKVGGRAYAGMSEVRARLQAGRVGREPTVLLITGVTSSQAIARVAVDLVYSMCESGLRTVLVDADLATCSASTQLRLVDMPGLAESLNGHDFHARSPAVSGAAAIGSVELSVLPAGKRTGDPALALSGTRLGQTVERLRDRYDFVVIAGPNMNRPAEVIPLLEWADHALLVAPEEVEARRLKPAEMTGGDFAQRFIGVLVVDSEH